MHYALIARMGEAVKRKETVANPNQSPETQYP
jgi:hypothetical protein